jgi:L-lysine 2,3-aminomutase
MLLRNQTVLARGINRVVATTTAALLGIEFVNGAVVGDVVSEMVANAK